MTPDEEKDLAVLKTRRELELQQVNELEELIQRKDSGEDVNEDRLYEQRTACSFAAGRGTECYRKRESCKVRNKSYQT